MMALAGVEFKTLVSEPDALTTRPPPCEFCKLTRQIPSDELQSQKLQSFAFYSQNCYKMRGQTLKK